MYSTLKDFDHTPIKNFWTVILKKTELSALFQQNIVGISALEPANLIKIRFTITLQVPEKWSDVDCGQKLKTSHIVGVRRNSTLLSISINQANCQVMTITSCELKDLIASEA